MNIREGFREGGWRRALGHTRVTGDVGVPPLRENIVSQVTRKVKKIGRNRKEMT